MCKPLHLCGYRQAFLIEPPWWVQQNKEQDLHHHRARSQPRLFSWPLISPVGGLCGRSMKPEGCFSSRHAEAALTPEYSTEQIREGTVNSENATKALVGRETSRSLWSHSHSFHTFYCLNKKRGFHRFPTSASSFSDFMWWRILHMKMSEPLESSVKSGPSLKYPGYPI